MSEEKKAIELNDEELGKVSGGFDNPDPSQFTQGQRVRVRFPADNAGLGWWTYYYGTVDRVQPVYQGSIYTMPTMKVYVWIDNRGSTAQPFDPEDVELVD